MKFKSLSLGSYKMDVAGSLHVGQSLTLRGILGKMEISHGT